MNTNTTPEKLTIPVLDKGFVELIDSMGNELLICHAARTLETFEPSRGKQDLRLLRYMYENGHTSPFEHVVMEFHVKAPIFVFRQWHRHRTWSYNEISGRYQELPEDFYVPRPEHIGTQSEGNHQSRELLSLSLSPALASDESTIRGTKCMRKIRKASKRAFREYRDLLEWGCPREVARSVLPVNTYSRMYCRVDLHNLMHFLRLRLNPHAQWEIREYAIALFSLMERVTPNVALLLEQDIQALTESQDLLPRKAPTEEKDGVL